MSPREEPSWIRSAATVGQLIIAFAGVLGTGAAVLLSYSDRLTRVEERQIGVIASVAELRRVDAEIKGRLDNDEHAIQELRLGLETFRTQMQAEHRALGDMIISSAKAKK